MSVLKNGGPAFPSGDGEYGGGPNHCYGMTLRDRFAIEAMGLAISEIYSEQSGGYLDAAHRAYEFADAMLAAREVQS